ncbi:MAG: hypothetical protein QNJ41_06580 [Xenococcaceae cyanobacterium MO_188.B32]|nr:hypothetical protein [Xenococcaceae cyanobacterium MO_188.B32]
MNKLMAIATSVILGLLVFITCFWVNTTTVFAHRPHDDVYAVKLSNNYQQDRTVFTLVRGNLLKSTDGGINWQRLTNGIDNRGIIFNLTIPKQNSQILYISSLGDGIYKSENGGESWFKVDRGLDNFKLDLLLTDSQGNRILAAGEEKGLYYSDDGGANWRKVIAKDKITALSFNNSQSERLLVGDRQGVLHLSEDDGKTWQQKAKIGRGSAIRAIAFAPNDKTIYIGTEKEGVWQSKDDGNTFTPINKKNAPVNIKDIVVTDDNTLLVSERNKGVFALKKNSKSWTKSSKGLTKDRQADENSFQRPHFSDLAISPSFSQGQAKPGSEADRTVFVAGFNGLFKSTDGGKKWSELDALSSRIVVGLAISPNYERDSTLAVVNYVGEAYISRDRGLTWQPMYKGLEIPRFTKSWRQPKDDPRRFFDLAFSPNYSKDGHLFLGTLRNYLLKSSNRGENWQITHLPKAPGYIRGNMVLVSPNLAVDRAKPGSEADRTVFVATNRGHLYQSTDEGDNFSLVGEVGEAISSLVISPNFANDYTFYASSEDKIYQSVDGGQTWTNIIDRPDFQEFWLKLAISPQYKQDKTLFAGTDLCLYKTEDGGDVWRRLPKSNYGGGGIVEAIALSPNYARDRTLIISIRGKGAWKSTDDGESFSPLGKLDDYLLPFSHVYGVHAAPTTIQFSPAYKKDNTLYGFGLPKASVLKSEDGGDTWQAIDIPPAAIFEAYRNNQYDLLTSLSLTFFLYRQLLGKFFLAAIAGLVSYWLVDRFRLDKMLSMDRSIVKLGSSVLAFSIVFLILVGL